MWDFARHKRAGEYFALGRPEGKTAKPIAISTLNSQTHTSSVHGALNANRDAKFGECRETGSRRGYRLRDTHDDPAETRVRGLPGLNALEGHSFPQIRPSTTATQYTNTAALGPADGLGDEARGKE